LCSSFCLSVKNYIYTYTYIYIYIDIYIVKKYIHRERERERGGDGRGEVGWVGGLPVASLSSLTEKKKAKNQNRPALILLLAWAT
jgi:hypothetical protein